MGSINILYEHELENYDSDSINRWYKALCTDLIRLCKACINFNFSYNYF